MNYFYRTPSIYQPINVFEASTSSAGNVWEQFAVARRMPQNVRTLIVPSAGEITYVNPLWNSVPVEAIQPDPVSVSGVGHVQINWLETIDAHIIKADVPGLRRQDLQVVVEGGPVLQISGERFEQESWPFDSVNKRQVERWVGGFMRRFRLPETVVIDRICADLDLGVLTITVPKLQRFPAVQWFVPITLGSSRAVDDRRSSRSSEAEGSLTDAFPRRISNSSSNDRLRTSGDEVQGQEQRQSRALPAPARASLVEVEEDRRPNKQRLSQRRKSGTRTGNGSRRQSARGGYSQTEANTPVEQVEADEIPTQATDLEAPEESQVDENAEEAVRTVLENMLLSLEMDHAVTNRAKTPNQSRRRSRVSQSSRQSSAGSSNAFRASSETGEAGSRRPSRRAFPTKESSPAGNLEPQDTLAATEDLLKTLGNNLVRRLSETLQSSRQRSSGNTDPNVALDSEAGTTGARRGSRRASQTNEEDSQPAVDQDLEPETTGSRTSSRRASQTNENVLHRRTSQNLAENAPEADVGQNNESRDTGSRRDSRRATQNSENVPQRRNSQNISESASQADVGQDSEPGNTGSGRTSRRASQTTENAPQGRSSQNLVGKDAEPNVRQDGESGTAEPSWRASNRETADPTNPEEDSPENAQQRRTTALENVLLNAIEKSSNEANAQTSRRNSQNSRRNSFSRQEPQQP